MTKFSERYGYYDEVPITIREEAPQGLRDIIWSLTRSSNQSVIGLASFILEKFPWYPYSQTEPLAREAARILNTCDWFEVYDLAEQLYTYFLSNIQSSNYANKFEEGLNSYFHKKGIGWEMIKGKIEIRGQEVYANTTKNALSASENAYILTANNELREAWCDLSRRPVPDITGVIQHAGAALECVARHISKEPKKTLGDILKRNPNILPTQWRKIAELLWGYVSENGRHLKEGHDLSREEAMLALGIVSSFITYFSEEDMKRTKGC